MKKKYFIIIAAIIICAAILCAIAWMLPFVRAAQTLQKMTNAKSIEYEADITLNQEKLSKGQAQFLEAASWILEVDRESCMSWRINGYISDAQGYAQVFCEGLDGAVTDVYFSEDDTFVNVKMLYEMLQDNFTSAHPILGNLLPDWKYSDYISLEQIEEIFQVDIRSMYKPDVPKGLSGKNIWEILMLLGKMEHGKSEDGRQQFSMMWNGYQTVLETGKAGQAPELSIQGTDTAQSGVIASYKADISTGSTREIVVPGSVMEQDEIEQFRSLWSIIQGMLGNVGKER